MNNKKTVGIVLNGIKLDTNVSDDYVICADGGYKLLKNRKPDIIIGDFDSLTDVPKDIPNIKHDAEKNQTDGEICIDYAVEKGYKQINIYSALGGRIDHVLGNLALLKHAYILKSKAVIRENGLDIYYAEKEFSLNCNINDTVSVVPFGGQTTIIDSKGLYYPLKNLNIRSHQTRGISNLTTENNFYLKIALGGIFVFHYHKV